MSQEPVLFSGSIKDNICYGLDQNIVKMDRILDACRKSNCLNFIQDSSRFPNGLDTLVGERGVKLSGG